MRKAAVLIASLAFALSANAQGIGLIVGAGAEKQISKGFDASVNAEYRQSQDFKSTDRWAAGLSVSKRLYRNEAKTFTVKSGVGYKMTQVFEPYSTKYKEDGVEFNMTDAYKVLRHRFTASLQAAYEFGRFKVSLRESYQYTFADSVEVGRTRYRLNEYGQLKPKTPDHVFKGDMNKSLLRSRIALDYNIPHWKYDPFISYELFSDMNKGLATDKSRFTAGVEFTFSKKHNFEVAYQYDNKADDDEPGGSEISISYTFKF